VTPAWVAADKGPIDIAELALVSHTSREARPETRPAPPAGDATRTVTSVGSDTRSLAGEVQSYRGGWRLRYARIDADDPYGGSVVLDGVHLSLRDGQHVRVQGQFIPPADRFSPARFQVESMETRR
jgi:hypothetical protein